MGRTPLKKVIKSKLKSNTELTELEKLRERVKYEIAEELGLKDKVDKEGWGGLTAEETGRIGGIMTKRKRTMKIPKNEEIQEIDERI
ncbi:benzoate transporter [Clostridium sp. K25]|uniref:Small acid-soluble spore protein n=3 Tax=Clostridium TaxID=1485 RepID=A0A9P2LKM8_CLOBO|nr:MULTISPECIES: small, acid-soluble spore protein, alpha/beta type [Clostridium]EES90638.1 small acid-soluble spore protein [Clostridium botulinum D str. 1873]KEI06616.1 benzoate transporter [Clostridium sp. K25]KEI16369.1 benzoate transporter [Clostridium novyi B str. ATCC 27606]KEI18567.1 benzoate transporter [Clostridium haemolyticum NCTC 9693]KGN04589.1 benzoate transporter [Clostridium haemolyticum NCTC 8350]